MTRYIKASGYHVALDYTPRDPSLFRVYAAWIGALCGAFLFAAGVLWAGLR